MTADEAKAVIDKFAAADSSMAAIAAVAEQLIDQVAADAQALSAADRCELDARREKERVDRDNENAYRRKKRREKPASIGCPSDVQTSAGCPSDVASSRACSSSAYLEESKIGGGGECARERARDTHENKLILREVGPPADNPEEVAAEVEQVVKRSGVGRWPEKPTPGWMRSTVIPQIATLLKAGVARNVILEAVRVAAENYTTGSPIGTFRWFFKPIMRAHAEATAQMALPLPPPRYKSVKGGRNELDAHYMARLAAADEEERRGSVGDAPVDGEGGAERSA
jgi:hypothetical protein